MGRRPKNPLQNLANTARAHLLRAEALGRSLDSRMAKKRELSSDWTPDEDWRRDFAAVTTTLQHGGNSLIRALEGNKKELGGLTEEQIEAQFQAEIVQSAPALTDEQWQSMCEARARAKQQPR